MKGVNKFGLLSALINTINTFEEDSSKVVIAKYLLQNFKEIHKLNIYETAEECFVTRASIRRFSKYIGFDNFRGLKSDHVYYTYDQKNLSPNDYLEFLSKDAVTMLIQCTHHIETQVQKVLKQIQDADQLIILSPDIYGSSCVEFQKRMILDGKMIRLVSYNLTGNKLLKNLKKNDLLLIISVTGMFAESLDGLATTLNGKKILLTEKPDGIYDVVYDHVIQITTNQQKPMQPIFHVHAINYCLDMIHNEYQKSLG